MTPVRVEAVQDRAAAEDAALHAKQTADALAPPRGHGAQAVRVVAVAVLVVAQLWGMMHVFEASLVGEAPRVLAFQGACFTTAIGACVWRRRPR